jgi:DNA-binding transcriptional ArsR family regulator
LKTVRSSEVRGKASRPKGGDGNLNNSSKNIRQELGKKQAAYFKALAHPLRITIVEPLRRGELTVNQIGQKFNVEQANASQQLAVLRHANIIAARKEGTNVHYSVIDPAIFKVLETANEILKNQLQDVRRMFEHL